MDQKLVRFWRDNRGQDLIEYALMAGFVAVAAGAIMPGVAGTIGTVFAKISAAFDRAASGVPIVPQVVNPLTYDPTIRIICAVGAVLFLGLIVLRRRKQADE